MRKKIISFLFIVGLVLSGCSGDVESDWKISPEFSIDNMTLHGSEGEFGIIKVNGEGDEPEFPVDAGRLYQVYFLEENFTGKNYKMTATSKDSSDTLMLYEGKIEGKQSGAKLAFNKKGLWKILVSVDEKPYTDFIIEVQNNK